MKKHKTELIIPLLFTVIPSIALSIYLFSYTYLGGEKGSIEEQISVVITALLSVASVVSCIVAYKTRISIIKSYLTSLGISLLLVGILIAYLLELNRIILSAVVFHLIIIISIVAVIPFVQYKENRIRNTIIILLLNPVLSFLPTLVLFLYELNDLPPFHL